MKRFLLLLLAIFMVNCVVIGQASACKESDEGVTFYKHVNYHGHKVTLGKGEYNLKQLKSKGIKNDDISSLKVKKGYEVVIYEDDNFLGKSWVLSTDTPSLIDVGCNDLISSVKIRLSTPQQNKLPTINVKADYANKQLIVSSYVPEDTVCTDMQVKTHFPNEAKTISDGVSIGKHDTIVNLPPVKGVTYPQCVGDYLVELCIDGKVVCSTTLTYSPIDMIKLPTMNASADYANKEIIVSCDVPEGTDIKVITNYPNDLGTASESTGIGKSDVIVHLPPQNVAYDKCVGDYFIELYIDGSPYCCTWLNYSPPPEIKKLPTISARADYDNAKIIVSCYVPEDTVSSDMQVRIDYPYGFQTSEIIGVGKSETIFDVLYNYGVPYPDCIGNYLIEIIIDGKAVCSTTFTYSPPNMVKLPTINARVDYANNEIIVSCDVPEGKDIKLYTYRSMSLQHIDNIGIGKSDVIIHLPPEDFIAGQYDIAIYIDGFSYCWTYVEYSPPPEINQPAINATADYANKKIIISGNVPGGLEYKGALLRIRLPQNAGIVTLELGWGDYNISVDLPPLEGISYSQCIGDYIIDLMSYGVVDSSTTFTYSPPDI